MFYAENTRRAAPLHGFVRLHPGGVLDQISDFDPSRVSDKVLHYMTAFAAMTAPAIWKAGAEFCPIGVEGFQIVPG